MVETRRKIEKSGQIHQKIAKSDLKLEKSTEKFKK